ncbi:four-helix bundle copper-binding protein [Pseudoduganella sp. UC29_106]|uniref:four-helix bundle copper-binding protein n=1 Tax=Pseudoduganella sp. UC29_106 TaxID=3374553 RepID=UPI003756C579
MDQHYQSCIDACNECAAACEQCAAACLREPEIQMLARCIALDIDCSQICRLASAFMSRGSTEAAEVCRACAEICESCGSECDQHQHEHCKACAVACHRCADECRRMGSMAQGEVRSTTATAAAPRH